MVSRAGDDLDVTRVMQNADFVWAASLMERRRAQYAKYSPVFWRPAEDVTEAHAQFMLATAARDGAVALRTRHGFAMSYPHEGRCFVDDFAVERDEHWSTEGRELLLAVWAAARAMDQPVLRAVTARDDTPKAQVLADAGLAVTSRWWVKELTPAGPATSWGAVTVADVDALVMPAPPVYDPGGPVCLLGDIDAARAVAAAAAAAACGAVLAIVQRDGSSADVPASEPELETAGFHNPSEFYEGIPS